MYTHMIRSMLGQQRLAYPSHLHEIRDRVQMQSTFPSCAASSEPQKGYFKEILTQTAGMKSRQLLQEHPELSHENALCFGKNMSMLNTPLMDQVPCNTLVDSNKQSKR